MTVSEENAKFWDELCGTGLARSLGIVELTPESLALFDRAYFDLYPYLRPLIDRAGVKDSNVLEIGLGFGSVGQYIAKQSSSYHAVDIAESPVALMRQRLIFQGLPGAQVQRGSALDLPYPDGSFDTVVSIGTLHHTGDLPRAIAEVHRVLRPGGRALVMVYNAHSFRRLAALVRGRFASVHGRLRYSLDARLRGMYDQRTDGAIAPHTDFVSARQARRIFSAFQEFSFEQRNFDDYVIWRVWFRRRWFLRGLDRVLGLDLYITVKR